MNTRQTRLALLGLAFGILLALLITPQTRWLVRAQLVPASFLPGHDEQQKQGFVRQHPNDLQIQLAGLPEDSHLSEVEYARSLVSRFPESASLRALILRYATEKEVRMHRDEDYLLQGTPVPARQADPNNPPPNPAELAAFDADAAAGERLDPDNAYFPFMRSIGLFAAHRDTEGLAAVQRASTKHVWREYFDDEVEGHWRVNDAVYGGREAVSATAVSASLLFPHYADLRAVARVVTYKAVLDEKAGQPEAGLALRRSVARCGELMGVQSTTLIGSLVGVAISAVSRGRPGGAPPLKSDTGLSNDQRASERVNLYCAYVTKIGHPEAAAEARAHYQTWQQIHRVTSKLGDSMMGGRMADFMHLVVALVSGWVLLANIVVVFLLGLIAAGLSRLPQIQVRRPLPAGAAFGFWSVMAVCLLLIGLYFDAGSVDFPAYAIPLVVTPLAFATLAALVSPALRRPMLTGLLTAGVMLGAFGLFGVLAAGLTLGGTQNIATVQQMFGLSGSGSGDGPPSEGKITTQVLILLGCLLALAFPLLCAVVLSLVSRARRVPVSVGLVTGFRAVMPPLVCVLMLVYGGLVLWTIQQEARTNYGLEHFLHGEGQSLAQQTGEKWPGG